MKVDTAGDQIWDKTYGIGNNEIAYGLRKSPDGGFMIVGSSQNFMDTTMSLYFVRTDRNGDTLWTKTILNSTGCAANSVILAADSNWVVCADAFNSMTNSFDACLIKMNDSGQLLWTKYFGGTSADNARRLTECLNGDIIFTGFTKSSGAGLEDIFIVRVNSNGDFVTAVQESLSLNSISIHPNPFSKSATIQLNPNLKNGKINIIDAQGKIVKTITNLESGSIDIEKNNLSKGIYFVNLIDANQQVQTKKIVIE